MSSDPYKKAQNILSNCDALLITAGAGMGVDSGLPDFRGNQGFWQAYPPIAKRGIPFYEMANPAWFEKDPKLAWAFYGHRLNLYRDTQPHEGYIRLHDRAGQKEGGYFVFTSNVDGQFQKAGFSDERIQECHGSIHHLQCSRPCQNAIWSAEKTVLKIDNDKFEARDPLPVCPDCGAVARPNILMFGDWSWISSRAALQDRQMSEWLRSLQNQKLKLVVIEIGAGLAVPTVRLFSEEIAMYYAAKLIRINPKDTQVPPGQISIIAGAAEGIAKILE